MSKNAYVYILLLCMWFVTSSAQAGGVPIKEYEVKAGFIYRITTFVEWPDENESSSELIIGIIGKDPFGDIFDPIRNKSTLNKQIIIRLFQGLVELKNKDNKGEPVIHPDLEEIQKCHVLFICPSEQNEYKSILNMVQDSNILTIGDRTGFLEAGGILNFLMEDNKIQFEINMIAAKQANLKIRSKLLRIARRVIDQENED